MPNTMPSGLAYGPLVDIGSLRTSYLLLQMAQDSSEDDEGLRTVAALDYGAVEQSYKGAPRHVEMDMATMSPITPTRSKAKGRVLALVEEMEVRSGSRSPER